MHFSCRNLTRSCKNRFICPSFSQDTNVSYKVLARIALSSQCFFIAQNVSDTFLSFPLQKCSKNLAVDSESSVSRQFRRRQEWSFPKRRDRVSLDKNCFILHFHADKINHYKTNDFEKFPILDAFKHFRWQTMFKRCKVQQILPLTVDYAWFWWKWIIYQMSNYT